VKERPILFSAPMVRALLAGTKTQTRRAWRVQPPAGVPVGWVPGETKQPYGWPGDRLWVRETFCDDWKDSRGLLYRADAGMDADMFDAGCKWRPSIHMPRAASRITLEVTGVRVERLRWISEVDALAEGITWSDRFQGYHVEDGTHFHCDDPRQSYFSLWEAINGPGSVEANPWVWVVEFRRAP
jgi:hypothetical protein